jgi:hypothetical protein
MKRPFRLTVTPFGGGALSGSTAKKIPLPRDRGRAREVVDAA